MTFEASKSGCQTPHGMKHDPSLGTGVAWDNFDRYVETSSGKGTLHDTVGIADQLVRTSPFSDQTCSSLLVNGASSEVDDSPSADTFSSSFFAKRRRRRSYESQFSHLEPYTKKRRIEQTQFLKKIK